MGWIECRVTSGASQTPLCGAAVSGRSLTHSQSPSESLCRDQTLVLGRLPSGQRFQHNAVGDLASLVSRRASGGAHPLPRTLPEPALRPLCGLPASMIGIQDTAHARQIVPHDSGNAPIGRCRLEHLSKCTAESATGDLRCGAVHTRPGDLLRSTHDGLSVLKRALPPSAAAAIIASTLS